MPALFAIAFAGCPSAKSEPTELPRAPANPQARSAEPGGEYTGPEGSEGDPQALANLALAPNVEVDERRRATRGLVSQAMGVEPTEIRNTEQDRFRMAKIGTVVRGTADMEAVEHLRKLMRESQDAEVIADAVRGLGHVRDIDSVPEMLALLSNEDPAVSEAAEYSVSRILGIRPAGGQPPAQFYRNIYKQMSEGNPDLHEQIKDRARRQAEAGP